MEQSKFKEVMAMLGEAYNKKITPLMAKMYWQSLKHLTDEQLQEAVMRYISDTDQSQFWPQPGAILAKLEGSAKQKELSVEDKAMQEWEKIKLCIRKVGAYGCYKSDDKVAIKAIQNLGGWVALCHAPSETLDTWKRKEFVAAYKIFLTAQDLPDYAPGIGHKSQEQIESSEFMKKLNSRIEN